MTDPIPLSELIRRLNHPGAFPHQPDTVRVIQTHISVVFLADPVVYKIKKPVQLGFLDFGTLERRHHFCEEEIRCNRRLAAPVYLGVVPVMSENGTLHFEGDGEPVEWAVKMRHLPDDASFESKLAAGQLTEDDLRVLGQRLASFHQNAESGEQISQFGRWDVVASNARENFTQTVEHIGVTVERSIHERLRERTETELARLRERIDDRARRHVPCDTHGDLRLEHVYHLPGWGLPADLALIDGIEFNQRFRYADPIADVAFLAMDLSRHGRHDLRDALLERYLEATSDDEGRELIPFYVAYRAVVRAKVAGIKATESEVDDVNRARAVREARAHWLLALGELESPACRPGVVMLSGLPGCGKSTLARGLSQEAGFEIVRSDEIRQELASSAPEDEDIYTPEWSRRTYETCLSRAEAIVSRGGRVVIDANFRREAQRREFIEAAVGWGVRVVVLIGEVPAEIARERLEQRSADASDADWQIYQRLVQEWEEPGLATRSFTFRVDCAGTPEATLAHASGALERVGLVKCS